MAARPKTKTADDPAPSTRSRPAAVNRVAAAADEGASDRLIYERARLGIMSALSVQEELTFNELKSLMSLSDGNLSNHARKLEEARYITCTKSFEERRPKTVYRITAKGRTALHEYLDHVEAVIKATRG